MDEAQADGEGLNAERQRLENQRAGVENWRLWGPYLSERAWGTVREDYSADGDAWGFLPHEHARSRAYRWNEDGLGGISRREPDPLLRARPVERPRPDPQGARLRPDRARRATAARTSRRSTSTSTRRRATATCATSTSIRRRRSPTRRWSRRTPAATG